MICADARQLLHAYLDDELDVAQSAAMATHLQGCATCAAGFREHQRLRHALAQPDLYRHAPAALRERWTPRREPADAVAPAAPYRSRRGPIVWALAAGFAGALLLATPLFYALQQHGAAGDMLADEAVSSHLRALQPQHLMDVVSTDQHTVKPWFDGKLDFSPRVVDLAGAGFPLVGGRLDALGGRSVAALVYRRHLHLISVYEWPAAALAASAALSESQQHGYTVLRWTEGGMQYVVVSDVDPAALHEFTQKLRQASDGGDLR
ncbi:anti-sigma factor [Rhodanobacter sp. 7MK24]|uniref:anti-sigma factor family protein n=1 Tax=Rhodanobacter sp. 7MK24 TaxID=2775922 RepID=UPI00177FDB13|nr:zf-HC2 domain-containing protein [Rhodanobacter sp. 7MK24]MBD8880329.1 anti-sigma factor [Rhodanobacter sp. 7MK24]